MYGVIKIASRIFKASSTLFHFLTRSRFSFRASVKTIDNGIKGIAKSSPFRNCELQTRRRFSSNQSYRPFDSGWIGLSQPRIAL